MSASDTLDAIEEITRLDPQPSEVFTLSTGTEVRVRPLRTRQFFRLMRILTRGGAPMLAEVDLDFDDPESFGPQLLAVIAFAIPEAEDEAVDFIKSMLEPADLIGDRKADKAALAALEEEVDNPDLDDLVSVLEVIIRREAEDLRALGNRLGVIFRATQKATKTPPTPTTKNDQKIDSSEASPEPSTL